MSTESIGLPVRVLSWKKNSVEHEAFYLSKLQCNKDDDDEEMMEM